MAVTVTMFKGNDRTDSYGTATYSVKFVRFFEDETCELVECMTGSTPTIAAHEQCVVLKDEATGEYASIFHKACFAETSPKFAKALADKEAEVAAKAA